MRALLACFVALIPGIALADVSMTYPQQSECTSTVLAMQISGSRMRFDSLIENGKFSTVFDGLEDTMTMLDHTQQQYHQAEVDEDAIDYNKDVMSSTGIFMDKQMKTVQGHMKEQCAQMEKQGVSCPDMDMSSIMQNAQAMMGQSMPKIEIRHSDKRQTVAGMACTTVDRYENSIKVSEECYVEPKDLLLPDKDKKHLLKNLRAILHYSDSFSGFTKKFGMLENDGTSLLDPANKDILLSKICLAPNGGEAGRVEAKISNDTIDEARFEIPPGYQLMNMTQ